PEVPVLGDEEHDHRVHHRRAPRSASTKRGPHTRRLYCVSIVARARRPISARRSGDCASSSTRSHQSAPVLANHAFSPSRTNSGALPAGEVTDATPALMYWMSLSAHFPFDHSSSASGMTPMSMARRSSASPDSDHDFELAGSPRVAGAFAPTTRSD